MHLVNGVNGGEPGKGLASIAFEGTRVDVSRDTYEGIKALPGAITKRELETSPATKLEGKSDLRSNNPEYTMIGYLHGE